MYAIKQANNDIGRVIQPMKRTRSNVSKKGAEYRKKGDHLFNNIPSLFENDISEWAKKSLAESQIRLKTIRDKAEYTQNVHKIGDVDKNNEQYSSAATIFKAFCGNLARHPLNAKPIVDNLFENSIDYDVKQYIEREEIVDKSKLKGDIDTWLTEKNKT